MKLNDILKNLFTSKEKENLPELSQEARDHLEMLIAKISFDLVDVDFLKNSNQKSIYISALYFACVRTAAAIAVQPGELNQEEFLKSCLLAHEYVSLKNEKFKEKNGQ